MSDQRCLVFNWNVRGLNSIARRQVVKDLVLDNKSTIVCLQETKLASIDTNIIRETLGLSFTQNFASLPAQQTRGGALLAVHEDFYKLRDVIVGEFTVSARLEATTTVADWWLTVVYGPQGDSDKLRFLQELRNIRAFFGDCWLVMGDFNLILQAQDKSKDNLNRRLMDSFRSLVDDLELKELSLQGRKFTWSNNTTHTRIDRAFCTVDWDLMLPNCALHATSSVVFDHSPLLLVGNNLRKSYRGFHFEVFWPRLQGYTETVTMAWEKELQVHKVAKDSESTETMGTSQDW